MNKQEFRNLLVRHNAFCILNGNTEQVILMFPKGVPAGVQQRAQQAIKRLFAKKPDRSTWTYEASYKMFMDNYKLLAGLRPFSAAFLHCAGNKAAIMDFSQAERIDELVTNFSEVLKEGGDTILEINVVTGNPDVCKNSSNGCKLN